MSRLELTTQDLFLRLGTTSQSRSVRADALFRRLRAQDQEQIAAELMSAPKRVSLQDQATSAPSPRALRSAK